MCTSECTVKLDDLISNINNESLKKICSSISDSVISTTDKQINNFYESDSNEHICKNTNEHIIQRLDVGCKVGCEVF